MLKKKLVTIVAAAFCVALVTAQSSAVNSAVNKVTTGLIGDGAIDSFKFGTEDGSGVIFGQYNHDGKQVVLGWGNLLSDTLWLSVYDAWNFKEAAATETATAKNESTADDGINVDFTKTTRKVEGMNSNCIVNTLGIGAGINNTLGFQLVWDADYEVFKNPLTKEEINDPGTGNNTKNGWTKFANNKIKNNFTVNFKGVGIEDLGDIAFFVKLNKVYFDWNSINSTGDYTSSTTINGKTISETTTTGKNTINTLKPGLNFDLGLNVIDNDIATVKFVYEDDFSMSFKPSTYESTYTEKNPIASASTETTKTKSYKVEYGKYLQWSNKFEPKLAAEFNVAEPLKLKAQLALPVTLTQTIDEVGKLESTNLYVETFDRTNGYSYLSTPKKTTTGKYLNSDGETQNKTVFKTEIAPKLSAGFVYEVTPGKFNVNFGVSAQPKYTWTTTTKTNANINTVTVTETKDKDGNVKTLEPVVVVEDNGVNETKTTKLSTGIDTGINLGATWFFTENVRFDAYILSNFNSTLFNLGSAGASVTVKF